MLSAHFTVGHVLDGELSAFTDAGLNAARAVALVWRERYMPEHYTHRGATRYNYVPRQGEKGSGRAFPGSYSAKKLQRFGHTYPQVWTGRSRAAALRGQIDVSSSEPNQFLSTVRLPWIYQVFSANTFKKPKTRAKWAAKGPRPLLAEMREITADELADLTVSGSAEWVGQLASINRVRKRLYVYRG